jgi:hypothetical protein
VGLRFQPAPLYSGGSVPVVRWLWLNTFSPRLV